MCGIAGYFGPKAIAPECVQTCLGLMHRRGPDHAAYRHWINQAGQQVYLLHSRLSIIDLDPRANQPFRVGSKWLALNGELYNYLELRRDLKAQGGQFTTESDTEVLLSALERHGWDVLDRCEGMWAFAVYDEADGSLTLCRDRFGEKPLYIFRDHDGLYFGSEVKFIAALLGRRLAVNFDHLFRYLVNGYKALYKDGKTFFLGLSELAPASTLHLNSAGQERASTYWQPVFRPDGGMTYPEAVAGVRERLIRSMELRLRADVPLAFCMSGGIDSNSLISIAKRVFNYEVHGFTVVVDDPRYDELAEVEYSVQELKIRHSPVPITTQGFREHITELIRQHDAPIYTISYYVQWLLMQSIANQGYRISVSGTGADELLTGYYDHHNLYLYDTRNTPSGEFGLTAWQATVAPLVRNPHLRNPLLYFDNPEFRDHIYLNNDVFASYLINPWREPFTEKSYTSALLRNRMLNEMFQEAVPVILHEDDLNAMYFSIENRSPYLDRELFEFSYRIPTAHLIRDGFAKVILRDAMAGVVPEKILWNRRKVGFNAPVFSFLDVKDAGVKEWLLADGPIFEHMRRDKIRELLQKDYLENSESKFLFNFVCAMIFLEEFGGI
jgi:asparagine synthase (glutamine-hydrolysing)